MAINKNTIKLPLDAERRQRIINTLCDVFMERGDEDSADEVTDLSDEELVDWADEELGDDDCFHEDDDGHLIED